MRDIRLLTLCKHHYLDYGLRDVNFDISCLGYYDGIKISQVNLENEEKRIAPKKSRAPISELWYFMGKQIEKISGGIGNQNIGLFRCIEEKKGDKRLSDYWDWNNKLPFFAVGFLKLDDTKLYKEIANKIENEYVDKYNQGGCISKAITYLTFDNADIIVLVKGNNVRYIEHLLKDIEYLNNVSYVHYIWGIDENYLNSCESENKVLEEWNGISCFLEENIASVCLEIATVGNEVILKELKYTLDTWNAEFPIKNYDNVTCSYEVGHPNCCIEINDTDVRSLVTLLLPSGFSTHKNKAYEHGVYNIETSFIVERKTWKEIEAKDDEKESDVGNCLCSLWLKVYSEYYNDKLLREDEGLYSHYQSWMQTLNMLDQYERFKMSNDIFYLIVPSLIIFEGNLRKVLDLLPKPIEMLQEEDINLLRKKLVAYQRLTEELKLVVCQYLDCMNSVIYHTIHTDQIYLMIPGYCGTPYSIPIKLNLFYLWYTSIITKILNDSERKFGYILTPSMESRPKTKIMPFQIENNENTLICIQLSQRSLFMPRNLLIILTHEIGHYVGRGYRNRILRREKIINILAHSIAEGILANTTPEVVAYKAKIREGMEEKLHKEITIAAGNLLFRALPESKVHADIMGKELLKACRNIIMSEENGEYSIYHEIFKIPNNVLEVVEENKEEYVDRMRYLSQLQKEYDRKRKLLVSHMIIDDMINVLIDIFKEIFSDMVTFAVLKCQYKEFEESFYVSEGMNEDILVISSQQKARLAVVQKVINTASKPIDINCKQESNPETLLDKVVFEEWALNPMVEYAKKCFKNLTKCLGKDKYKDDITQIRAIYQMFCNQQCSCDDIFAKMNICITEYRNTVSTMLEDVLNNG